ncbi:MAG: hypothetical protein M3Q65_06220, partial [Chloroflexota bacterium]|nr:hypothetical protein [Chloroflexota bacterium]
DEAVLFDTAREADARALPEGGTISRLRVRFPDGESADRALDSSLSLLIFVDDLSSPRARVRLADLVRQRGERPLNLLRGPGQPLRIVLLDPAGVWSGGAPRLEVALVLV